MTRTYSSRKGPKLLLIPGLNNNLECFFPLRDAMIERGFDAELVCLPGHDEAREDARTLDGAVEVFISRVKPVTEGSYSAIAFSTGALYLHLAITRGHLPPPEKQVLLAPAFALRSSKLLPLLSDRLPQNFRVPSFAPRVGRNRDHMYVWEYRTFMAALREFQLRPELVAPTRIIVDPADELVSARELQKQWPTTFAFDRRWIRRIGGHHLLFHPDYHRPEEWRRLLGLIAEFL